VSTAQRAVPVLFAGERTVAGTVVRTSFGNGGEWASALVGSLAGDECAVAAIPFEPGGPAVAHTVRGEQLPAMESLRGSVVRHEITERPTSEEYAANVRFAIDRIEAGALQKVVLGRGLDVISTPPLSPASVLHGLLRDRPGRYVFGMPLVDGPEAPQLLGASPELLVRRRGERLVSLPLAGSIPRAADPVEDRQRAEDLQHSTKDLAEHSFVVDEIVEALSRVCRRVEADPRPRLVSTDTLHHLGTRISAELAVPDHRGLSALHLAQLLQPTPAVGGVPRSAALDVIAQLESDRGPLTGAVGWVDGSGDGEFAVTIRAGVLDGERLRLYAGAGIVAGSDPESELRETGAKLATMLKAVGV
jgi:isochorismate synthase